MNTPQYNSVTSLKYFYSVVIALAFSQSILKLLSEGLVSVKWFGLLLFLAFLITLIPFYHGAIRHFDKTYIESADREICDGSLLFDFIMLFIEACLIVILGLSIRNPNLFLWILIALLFFDAFWVFISHIIERKQGVESCWGLINIVTGSIILIFYALMSAITSNEILLAIVILAICIARTVCDYTICWNVYFPSNNI